MEAGRGLAGSGASAGAFGLFGGGCENARFQWGFREFYGVANGRRGESDFPPSFRWGRDEGGLFFVGRGNPRTFESQEEVA